MPEWILKLPKPSKLKKKQMGKVKRADTVNAARKIGRNDAISVEVIFSHAGKCGVPGVDGVGWLVDGEVDGIHGMMASSLSGSEKGWRWRAGVAITIGYGCWVKVGYRQE